MGLGHASWINGTGNKPALALVDLTAWIRSSRPAVYVMFALCSLSSAAMALFEWDMMRAATPERWAQSLRWAHVPLALLTISLVLFVRLQFQASRRSWTMPLVAISIIAFAVNFLSGSNLEFREVSALRSIQVWETVAFLAAKGPQNPWLILAATNAALLVAFLIDTILVVHKHGSADERAKVGPVCLGILVFLLPVGIWEILVAYGLIVGPLSIAPPFMGISLVIVYVIGSDILKASMEHRAARERLGALVESMPSTALLLNDHDTIGFANKPAETMFRYAHAQMIGMGIESLIAAKYRTAFADLRRTCSCDGTGNASGVAGELFALRSDGSEIIATIGLTPVQIDREQFTVVSITDIGERRRAERDAALQRDELAHLARAASLSALSNSLAHELVQPLTAILSNAQAGVRLLARQPSDIEAVRTSLDHVVVNAKRASDVIRKLRGMLRKDRSEFSSLDINDVVRDILQLVRSDLIERRVEVVLELKDDLALISGDKVLLQQVMMNLLMNASDAMSRNEGARRLTVRTMAVGRGELEVQVADTGTGIPAEDLDRIFIPFVTSKEEGMGIGLAVCTMLIQAHEGRLWATNNDTRGATLHCRLPCHADDPDPQLASPGCSLRPRSP
jgi:two-component system sensor kinase FixL